MSSIPKIVLTGGPCAGKTTVLSFLVDDLGEMGRTVFVVPEAATLLLSNGIRPRGVGLGNVAFQRMVLQTVLRLEEVFGEAATRSAEQGFSPVIICDRGAMDGLAYTDPVEFARLADSLHHPIGELLGPRYSGVIHLRSAAVGVESAYGLSNPVRTETVTEARAKDAAVQNAWCGHPHLRIIPTEDDFAVKKQRVLEAVCAILGIPTPLEIERKFIVSLGGIDYFPVTTRVSHIEQWYLRPDVPGVEERIRRRTQDNVPTHYHTRKISIGPGVRSEEERVISGDEYQVLLGHRNPRAFPINKTRTCFVYKDQYFELDVFGGVLTGLVLFEIELTNRNSAVELPPFITVQREVTDDERYSNHSLALHGKPED